MKKVLTHVAGILALTSCSGEQPTSDDIGTDTESEGPECQIDDDCVTHSICNDSQECVIGDRDDEFDGATAIRITEEDDGPNVRQGMIHTAGDVDFYAYESAGDEWLRVFTRSDDNVEDGLDTVVSVYRSNGKLHHVMDEFGTGSVSSFDSLMNVYIPDAGTWYIKVEDVGTYNDDGTPRGQESFLYDLGVQEWRSITSEPDSADDQSITFEMRNGNTIYPLGVVIDEAGDVDYTSVKMPHGDAPFEIWAPSSIPGSELEARVTVTDDEGQTILVKDNIGDDGIATYFDGWNTTWNVSVSDVREGQGSQNHWTVLYFRTRTEGYGNPRESEPNNDSLTANLIETEESTEDGVKFDRGFLQSVLGSPDDEDFFQIEGVQDGRLRVVCSSSRYGSLGDVELEVIDPDGKSLGIFSDGDDSAPDLDSLEDINRGLYTLRFFEKDGAGSLGVYFRCGAYVYHP
ncbi:MAG: hypothetical protein ACI9MC_002016 [Kiritimatiellia bacterium]